MCLYPKLIQNPKYKATKKNGGVIPAITDDRVKYVPIGCQRCIECTKQKARNWQVRLLEDIKTHKNAKFITLTFTNEAIAKLNQDIDQEIQGYERDNAIATLATRRFLERWRKEHKKSLRHWLVTEIGGNNTENIHLHGIIWTDEPLTKVQKHWQYGFTWIGKREFIKRGKNRHLLIVNYVNEKTVGYITKYVSKIDELHKNYKAKILTSAGIGHNYTKSADSRLNKFNDKQTNETYRTRTGHKIALPIYWRNKLYTEKQRELLWLHKLDKQIRWVCGEKIDISKDDKTYYRILEFHRRRNKQLGYGDDTKNWDQIQYEEHRRRIKLTTRIKNAYAAGKYSKGSGLKN